MNLVVGSLDIELHGAINHLDKCIEGRCMFRQSLSFVEAEHGHASCCIVYKLFAHYATFGIVNHVVGGKNLTFLEFLNCLYLLNVY